MTNTPNFDAALDKILADLKPHTRVCTETGESFDITERDIEMLKLLRVPPPKTIWWSRVRNMRAYMAGVDLFRRAMPDGESGVSMYDPESPVPILQSGIWHSDAFNPLSYGIACGTAKPFFGQWKKLSLLVPRPAIVQDSKSVNSEWSVYSIAYKNCYQCTSGFENEDCVYADLGMKDKHCSDISGCDSSEWCYDCVTCRQCSRTVSSESCESCVNLFFSLACKNCSDCFGCSNLRNKKFCFLNEQLTEKEYKKRLSEIDLSDGGVFEEWKARVRETVWKKAFRLAGTVLRSENCFGDEIADCRDVFGIRIFNSERLYQGYGVLNGKDSMFFSSGVNIERCYMTCRTDKAYDNKMTLNCENCISVEYSELLTACEDCFGCIGLKHKKYCVFNKQYSEEEYWPLVDAIKTAMLERGEYGSYFPYADSPFAYNTSFGDLLYPMEEKAARSLGVRWYNFPEDANAEPSASIPVRLSEVTDELLKRKFRCPITGRAFAFVRPELELHKELGIALPRVHPNFRRSELARQSHPANLHKRTCAIDGVQVMTRIPATVLAPIYCQKDYEKAVTDEAETLRENV